MIDISRLNDLKLYLKSIGNIAVAFSGGLDSTFLLTVSKGTPGTKVIAFTLKTPYIPFREIEEAIETCSNLGVKHIIMDSDIPDDIRTNPENRCYICKNHVFKKFISEAEKLGNYQVVDGTNLDDVKDYRPGMKALKELGIKSPLLENNFSKNDIRNYSRHLGIKSWNKPAYACLLTRIPYNTFIRENDLYRIEKAELFLHKLGFHEARVRIQEDMARIEINADKITNIVRQHLRDMVVKEFKKLGFHYISLDMEGYRTGSMNINIK